MRHVLQWDQPTTPVKDAIKKPPTSCRTTGSMRMMWCVGSQSSVSQMNLLLHGSIWLQTMVSNRSISCRDFESMRINECVVKRRTVQSINKPSYIVHCSFVLFVLSYCALFYSYDPDFLKQWLDSWDDHHHVLRTPYKYDVVCLYAHERTRRTHKMSCGWTNVYDLMRNESDIRTHRISTITRLHAQCSYDENCVATASLLLGIFFGLIKKKNVRNDIVKSTSVSCGRTRSFSKRGMHRFRYGQVLPHAGGGAEGGSNHRAWGKGRSHPPTLKKKWPPLWNSFKICGTS